MNTQKIDIANIGLIALSLIVAVYLPFKLFLFSYAILGPIHYLTEINWLNDRKFFAKENKNWIYLLALLGSTIVSIPVLQYFGMQNDSAWIQFMSDKAGVILLIAFLVAMTMILLKGTYQILSALLLIILILGLGLGYLSELFVFLGAFLPTLIHVYLFTLIFIIYGAIKSRSTAGFLLAVLHALVPLIIVYLPISYTSYAPDTDTINAFVATNMHMVNGLVAQTMGFVEGNNFQLLSEIGIRIQIFITFAYTYHYLNWFSKTSIIGWGKSLTKPKSVLILLLCGLSSGLYFYDFKMGFLVLLFLSYLHVLLEFPLNVVSAKEIAKWSWAKLAR